MFTSGKNGVGLRPSPDVAPGQAAFGPLCRTWLLGAAPIAPRVGHTAPSDRWHCPNRGLLVL